MSRQIFSVAGLAVLLGLSVACTSTEEPLAPTTPSPQSAAAGTLKVTAPTPVAPLSDAKLAVGSTEVVLTSTASTALFTTGVPLTYEFQVINPSGATVADSLVPSPSATVDVSGLPVSTRHTWRTRATFQGNFGPWSSTASFVTADTPPDPYGNYQKICGGLHDQALVECLWNLVKPGDEFEAFEITKRYAWMLRGEGTGLLIKPGGENIVPWQGYSFAAARICFPDGHIYKLLGDVGVGGHNSPSFSDNDFVDKSLYVPAIDPSKK